jgi:glycosyltransferase involved in cell wall biosynthesis
MRIALDCRVALERKTGDRTYCLTLLHGLKSLRLDPARFQFDLLLHQDDEDGILPRCEYFTPHVLRSPNWRAWTLRALPRWAREHNPDLVHVQYLAPWGLPCPFISSIHDVVWRSLPSTFPSGHRRVMNVFAPLTARRAALVLCGTESARSDILKYLGPRPERVKVTPYAVDPQFAQSISEADIERVKRKYLIERPYVLSVGVQQPRKNIERLVRAWAQFKSKFPDDTRQLAICGKEGWGDKPRVTGASSELVFTGYADDADLPALYAGADLFAYPSLYEGFGLPILEAMSCHCAVLTSDRGAMREVAGGAAQTCDPESVPALAQGLENVLRDESWRANLRTMGLKRALEFSPEKLALQTLQAYVSAAMAGKK